MTSVIINPRLDFFSKPPLNVTNKNYAVTVSDPTAVPVGEAPITFVIQSDANFLNFQESLLRFKLKIVLENGGDLPAAMSNHVGFVPNIFHSIFNMVRVRVNDHPVTPASDLYSYKAYIDTLFSKTMETTNIDLLSGGDFNVAGEDEFGDANPSWARRAALCNLSALQEYSGQLAVDFLKCSRNILPNTKVEIVLFPQPARFAIQRDGHNAVANTNFKYVIQDCQFMIRREEVSSTALLAIESRLAKDMASYYYPLGGVKPYNLAQGIFSYRADDIFNNQLPIKLLVAFTRSTSFNGTYASSPFYLNPTDEIEHVEFFKNGVRLGQQRTQPINLAAAGTDIHIAYRELNKAVNGARGGSGLPYPVSQFRLGLFFAALDLTPDGCDDMSHRYPTELGAVSVYVKFRNQLPHALEMLVYGVFQEELNINQSRAVITSVNI